MSLHDVLKRVNNALTVSKRYSGEDIFVDGDLNNPVAAKVVLREASHSNNYGRSQTLGGFVLVKVSDAESINNLKKLTIRGAVFRITDTALPVGGLVKISVEQLKRETTAASSELGGF